LVEEIDSLVGFGGVGGLFGWNYRDVDSQLKMDVMMRWITYGIVTGQRYIRL